MNPSHEFNHLANSPIVEAVINWQAKPNIDWSETQVQQEVSKLLPEYSKMHIEKNTLIEFGQSMTDPDMIAPKSKSDRFSLVFESDREPNIANFKADGFSFSRQKPYTDWDSFTSEAVRIWDIYCSLLEPQEIQQLGVRYINKIPIRNSDELRQMMKESPTQFEHMRLKNFYYQSVFEITGEPLEAFVIKTSIDEFGNSQFPQSLFLDINVYTTVRLDVSRETLQGYLKKLKYFKNKVFFDLLTQDAIETFKG